MDEKDAQLFADELKREMYAELIKAYNQGVETIALPIAKRRCPKSKPNRASTVEWSRPPSRKFPRLSETIYVKNVGGKSTLASDDPRAGPLEYAGMKPHGINAKNATMKFGGHWGTRDPGLMWRTESGTLVKGWYGVLHPGFKPKPFLNPAMYEFNMQFVKEIPTIIHRVTERVAAKYI